MSDIGGKADLAITNADFRFWTHFGTQRPPTYFIPTGLDVFQMSSSDSYTAHSGPEGAVCDGANL
jgi:hypothetical protein